jgi:hypothetical protein
MSHRRELEGLAMMDAPPRNDGARVPDEDSQHGVAVMCARCRRIVDLTQPLALDGWQAVHTCGDHVIEALPVKAGEVPWAWRARNCKDGH